jgi:hypothetical protein
MENTELVEGTFTEIKDPTAVLAALERAKNDAKRFRMEKEAVEQEIATTREKANLIQTKLKNDKIIRSLHENGVPNADKLLKYIKTSEIELTDDFEINGLDLQLNDLRNDFPELFNPKKIVGGRADSGVSSHVDTPLSASELQAKYVLGN